MKRSGPRRKIGAAIGVSLVAGLAYLLAPLVLGRGEMREFCGTLRAGMDAAAIQAAATPRGYRMSPVVDGRALLHAPRSFGRFICELRFSGGVLQSAVYGDND